MIEPKYRSFNSQRDGILHCGRVSQIYYDAFQFPTGQNSTIAEGSTTARCVFQFPTGWNSTGNLTPVNETSTRFNSQRDGILLDESIIGDFGTSCFNSQRDGILHIVESSAYGEKVGFNSQRDGILPSTWLLSSLSPFVSIPNGMEFYVFSPNSLILDACFNSQRDGILRALKRQEIPLSPKFQFPTGWNSTRYFVASRVRTSSVSIPNGMEFYLYSLLISDKSCVSIPNGMEFYQINKFCFSGRIEFQFPTGWNSTMYQKAWNL